MSMAQERDCPVWQAQRAFKREMALLSAVQTTLVRKEKLAGGLSNPTAKNTPPTSCQWDRSLPRTGTAHGVAEVRTDPWGQPSCSWWACGTDAEMVQTRAGTSRWRRQMVKNGTAQPLGLEPSAGCKREGPVADEWHQTQAESGPAPQGWDGPMAEQPRVAHGGMT